MDTQHHGKAILWILLACFTMGCMANLIRYLSADINFWQITFFRNIFALLFFLPWVAWAGRSALKTERLGKYWMRAMVGLIGMYFWFYALATIPLNVATALSFTAPLFTAVLAIFIFGERYGLHRSLALLIGFIGVLVVLRPGSEAFDIHAMAAIAAAFFWGFSSIFIKQLAQTDKPVVVAFYMVLMMTPFSAIPAILTWQPIPPEIWLWLAVLGLVSNVFQVAMTIGFSLAPFSVLLPFDYTRLLFTGVLAYFIFGEVIDGYTITGSLFIMLGAAYAAYRTALKRREQKQASGGLHARGD